jgi:hypothetical protein
MSVATRADKALAHIEAERVTLTTDCGRKQLPRARAPGAPLISGFGGVTPARRLAPRRLCDENFAWPVGGALDKFGDAIQLRRNALL